MRQCGKAIRVGTTSQPGSGSRGYATMTILGKRWRKGGPFDVQVGVVVGGVQVIALKLTYIALATLASCHPVSGAEK